MLMNSFAKLGLTCIRVQFCFYTLYNAVTCSSSEFFIGGLLLALGSRVIALSVESKILQSPTVRDPFSYKSSLL